jgi:hypothetical protein
LTLPAPGSQAVRARQALGVAAYCLGVLVFFEASARLALQWRPFFKRVAGNDDSAWRLRWISRREESAGPAAYAFDVRHPTRGWALAPGLREVPVFGNKRLNSSSRGIRGTGEPAFEKPPGRRRILAFGDSFTFGEGVSDAETYAAALEDLLPGHEVINFGVHGYGHDQMLLYLREEGVRYHPDVVLLGFVGIDMDRNLLGFRDFAKPHFERTGQGLVLRGTPVPTPEDVLRAEPWRSKLADLWFMMAARVRERVGAVEASAQALTADLLDAFRAEAHGAGAAGLLAYLPVLDELDPARSASPGERFLADYCGSRNADCLDLRPVFLEKQRAGAGFGLGGHWRPRQHRLAGEALAPRLRALRPAR